MPNRPEGGGRHVLDPGIFGVDLPVREQDARNQRRVHAMIAAPGLGVVLENARGDAAGRRLPGGAIAVRISDDEIRRGAEIRTLIDIRRCVDVADGDGVSFRIAQAREPGDQFASSIAPPLRARRRPAIRGRAGSDTSRPGRACKRRCATNPRPKNTRRLRWPRLPEREIAVLMQPGVQIDSAIEGSRSRGRRERTKPCPSPRIRGFCPPGGPYRNTGARSLSRSRKNMCCTRSVVSNTQATTPRRVCSSALKNIASRSCWIITACFRNAS